MGKTENLLEIKVNNIKIVAVKKYGTNILFNYPEFNVQNALDGSKFSDFLAHSTLHTNNDRFTLRTEKLISEKCDEFKEVVEQIKQSPYAYKVNNSDSFDLYREDDLTKQIKIGPELTYVFTIALDFKDKKITDFISNKSLSSTIYLRSKNFVLPEEQESFAIGIYIARNDTVDLHAENNENCYIECINVGKKRYFIKFGFKFPIKIGNIPKV